MWRPIDALVSLSKMWISTAYCFPGIKRILPEKEKTNASPHPVFSSTSHPTHSGSLSTPWFRFRKTIFPIVLTWVPWNQLIHSLSPEPSKILLVYFRAQESCLCEQWPCAYFLEVQGITSPSPLTGFTSKGEIHQEWSCKHHWHGACWMCHGWSLCHKDMNKWGVHYNNLSLYIRLSEEHFCKSLNKHLTPSREESRLCGCPLEIRRE